MSKQVNVRLSEFHVELLLSMQEVYSEFGNEKSQAKIIETALEIMVSHPKMESLVGKKMDLGMLIHQSSSSD